MPKPLGANGERNMIAARLKELRAANGFSQRALAEQLQLRGLDIDKNAITRIEMNKRYVTDIELCVLAKLFGVSIEDLMFWKKMEII